MWVNVCEILGLLLPILITVLIWRRRFTWHLRLLGAILVCYLTAFFSWRIGTHLHIGSWRWALICITISGIAALLTWFGIKRLNQRWHPSPTNHTTRMTRILHVTGNLLLSLGVWLSVLVVLDVSGNLLAHSPSANAIRNHAWVIHRFMPAPDKSDMDQDALDAVMAQQNQLFTGITRQVRQTRQWLYDQTGLSAIVKQINALQEILGLSHAQCARLMLHTPALRRLTNHPLILRLVKDPRIVQLIEQAAEGRSDALWALYQHPDINALFEDQALCEQFKALDLDEMLAIARDTGKDHVAMQVLPVIWFTTVLSDQSDLQRVLQTPQHWHYQDNAELHWDDTTQLAAATAQVHAQPNVTVRFELQTQAIVTAIVDDKPVNLQPTTHGIRLTLIGQREPMTLVLLLDFSQTTSPRSCIVRMVEP